MWTLALETTSSHGSVALLQHGSVATSSPLAGRHYGSALFHTVARLLSEFSLELGDIGLFAVADGPGSFTGVRIGLTAVKGWTEVLEKPAVAVSTLRAIAGATEAPALAVIDAGRNEVYAGWYAHGTIDWHGTPLGYAERPAYARPGWDPGPSPAGGAPFRLPETGRPSEFRGLLAPSLSAVQTARRPRLGVPAQEGGAEAVPQSQEWVESLASFRREWGERIAAQRIRAVSPDLSLRGACPWLSPGETLLAPAVGMLGCSDFRAGYAQNALQLDARYIRRADAEMAHFQLLA